MDDQKLTLRQKLAAAYRILALKGMDDLTYTHLSVRSESGRSFYIQLFGLVFAEVKSSDLLEVDFNGNVLDGREEHYNKTGYVIHGSIYKNRPDINAIFHLHTHAGIAVSAMKEGLLPISQFALHFFNKIAYHPYDSLALENIQGDRLVKDLGDLYVAFLENHGTLTSGRTIEEAMFYTHHLEQACKVQVLLTSRLDQLSMPNKEICEKAVKDLLSFEKNLGERDWKALIRQIDRVDPSYLT